MRRRALLGTAATAPLLALHPGCATAEPRSRGARSGGAPAVPIRERLAALRLGANVERWFAIVSNKHPRRLGPAWWRGFRNAGFDHIRMFIPEVGLTGDGEEVLGLFREAVADANGAGLPVLLGLADFIKHDAQWSDRDWAALTTRAAYFGRRTDPALVVFSPVNEAVFPDAAQWMPVRDRLLGVMRRAAPRHTLMWGGHEWGSWRSLIQNTPPADPDTVAELHDYDGGDAAAVADRFGQVVAWRERHGQVVLVSEIGGAVNTRENRAAWSADLQQSLPVLRRLRLPAALWAYTYGSHWRLQPDESPTPFAEFRAVIPG